MIKIRFYCWWKHRVGKLKIIMIEADWDVTALYFYFGLLGFAVAIKVLKYVVARKFKRAEYEEDYPIFT